MKKQTMTYEAPELYLISVCVEKGFAASSSIEPGTDGGELGGTRSLSYDDYEWRRIHWELTTKTENAP